MIKKIKITINENRKLLNEMSIEDAWKSLSSKNTRKVIFQYIQNNVDDVNTLFVKKNGVEKTIDIFIESLKDFILQYLPTDIEEDEKALCIIWMKKYFLSKEIIFKRYILNKNDTTTALRGNLERFFQFKRFLSQEYRDLNKVEDEFVLKNIVSDARAKYKEYQEKQAYNNADEGTEKILENNEWQIFIAHNKGAACTLGKGTDWCTAAPGLDYFAQYYKENDPLFIFIDKLDGEKYQFHFGTEQFMDKSDQQIDYEKFHYMRSILREIPGLINKYPIISKWLERDQDEEESGLSSYSTTDDDEDY